MTARTLRHAFVALGLFAALSLAPMLTTLASAQTPQLIVDLLTTPQKHWNTTVVVKGHVRTVTPNPPGTSRGTFVFRDSSDCDITVVTSELPAVGREYTITATVEQETTDAVIPVLREINRRLGVTAAAPAPSPESASAPKASTAAPLPSLVPAPPAPAAPAPPAVAVPAPAATPEPAPAAPVVATDTVLGFSRPMVFGLIGLVAILSLGLIVAFRPRPAAPPMVELEPRVIVPGPRVMPQLPGAAPSAGVAEAADQAATRFVPPPPVAPAAATTVFVDLGADLVVAEGPDAGKKFALTKPRITIGRRGGRANEVELTDQSVSREHAKIVFNPTDQTFNLINESTTNPARVNGTAIESALLQNNDTIQLGSTSLKFVRKPAGSSA